MVDILPRSNLADPAPVPQPVRPKIYGRPRERGRGAPVDARVSGPINAGAYTPRLMEVPGLQDGFAPTLHPEGAADPPGVPDPIRVGKEEPALHSPDPKWHVRRGRDENERRSVETTYAAGWRVRSEYDPVPFDLARIPEARDVQHSRPTQEMGQNTYLFVRGDFPPMPPFRTGEHFSLADHRRITEIMGQRPKDRKGMNTYRVEPQPWDASLTVAPEISTGPVRASSFSGNKSYRARGGSFG